MSHDTENPAANDSLRVYNPAPIERQEHKENSITQVIEQQSAKLPSSIFLVGAIASMFISMFLEVAGHSRLSRFVGMWSPTLLIMGVYNKLIKMFGPR